MKTTPCPDCGKELTRNQRKSHSKLYCPANGAPATKERKCAHGPCLNMFVPKPGNPQQAYCHKRCWVRSQHAKRAERWQREKIAPKEPLPTEEERNAKDMAPIRRVEETLRQQAEQYVPVMGAALVEITLRLMGSA